MQTEARDERKKSNAEYSNSDSLWSLYELRTRYSPLPLVITEGPQHLVRYANEAFCELAKKSPDELQGLPIGIAVPEGTSDECAALFDRVFSTKVHETLADKKHTREANAPHRWTYAVWSLSDLHDARTGLLIKVSETEGAEQSSKTAAEVAEALLLFSMKQLEAVEEAEQAGSRLRLAIRETEHRAKNSLQTISAVLGMLLRSHPQTVPTLELAKLQIHIRTIGAMHNLLTFIDSKGGKTISQAPVKTTLEQLLPMWQALMGTGHVEWSCDDIELPAKECASIVTIINELVCNSVKQGAYTVIVKLSVADGTAALEVSDDGPGFAENFRMKELGNFGLKFVETVVRKELNGEITYGSQPSGGASVKVCFPLIKADNTAPSTPVN